MSFESLDLLERRVAETAERLTALREENAVLRARVIELEHELSAGRPGADGEAWARERDALRRRLEKLSSRLAELLSA
jgi:hypothetical protein